MSHSRSQIDLRHHNWFHLFKTGLAPAIGLVLLTACAEPAVSASSEGKGGGDRSLQKTLADPAPYGEIQLEKEILAEDLNFPWSIAFLPDGRILVSEREGALRVIENGELREKAVTGTPKVFAKNQGGLFDILPHPNFSENKLIYLAYAAGTAKKNATRLAKATFTDEGLEDLQVIYDAIPLKDAGYHFGGRLTWGGDGKLYLSVGEGSKYKEKAQDMTTSFGAVIRLNEDGSVPDDNPDFGPDAAPGLFSKGHRNPQGLTYDPERNILWETEHGPRGGDEINIVEAGVNYGWPFATYGIDYNGQLISPFTEYEGTRQPFKYWTPSIAPSGLAIYRGDLFPADWDGDLLVGALAGQALHRIDLNGTKEVGEERYDLGGRIRDVRVGPDGAIYLAIDEGGIVARLVPTKE
ncbi:MAG: PQQ-dependent sugar dehydrogenase [Pseudomonadota bacterium]